jgi:hypothetical protein
LFIDIEVRGSCWFIDIEVRGSCSFIDIDIKVRMISYWSKLILGNQSKIPSLSYKLLYIKDFQNKNVTSKNLSLSSNTSK